ncbi:MAG: alpha/beta hydrolase [Actinomycetota bacterium]
MLAEQQFSTGSITINYATSASGGPPLVLLHGFMGRWQDWLPIVSALGADWRIYAPDMRGHGRSSRAPDGAYRHIDLVEDLMAFLEGVVAEPAVLFGHSAGAPGASDVAGSHGGAVRAVIIGDFPLDFPWLADLVSTPGMVAYHTAVRSATGMSSQDSLQVLAALHPELDPSRLAAIAEALTDLDPHAVDCHAEGRLGDFYGDLDGDALLRRVQTPVALLQADPGSGGLMTDGYVQHALPLLRSGTHLRLDGIGHNLGLDTGTAGPLLDAVIPYLDSL